MGATTVDGAQATLRNVIELVRIVKSFRVNSY